MLSIDPVGFKEAKAQFFSRPNRSDSLPHQTTTLSSSGPDTSSPQPESPRDLETKDLEASSIDLSSSSVFTSARSLHENIRIPEAQLIIKKGHVRRQAGIRSIQL
jgi:hypothetical protein